MRALVIDAQRCTRCRTCEYVCSLVKEGRFNPRSARLRVAKRLAGTEALPVVCLQCERPTCLATCPVGALLRDETTGAIVTDLERCTGCRMCQLACPVGASASAAEDGKPRRCDLCGGEPRCVAFCPSGALRFEELTAPGRRRRRLLVDELCGRGRP